MLGSALGVIRPGSNLGKSVVLHVSKERVQTAILDLVQGLVLSRYLQSPLLTFPSC